MDIYEARRLAVLELIRSRFAGKQVAFVEATGIPASYVSRMLKQPGEATRKRIGEDIARKIEDKLGLKADAVVSPISQMGAYAETLVAQSVSYTPVSIPSITREELMQELRQGRPLPPKFELSLWDDALAPKAPRGTPATFVTVSQRAPQIGDAVLLVLNGEAHVRVLRQAATGGTVAAPTDGNYATFDASTSGLSIVAVLESLGGGWANLTR